jgi:hypothetical protein
VNKFSIIFLIAIFSSIVFNPLFAKNGIPEGFTFFSKALGDESSDKDGGDSGDDQKDDSGDDQKDDSGDDQKDDSGDDQKDDSGDDQTTDDQTTDDQTTDDQTTDDQTTDDKCNKKEVTDETTNDETADEKCDTKESSDETNNDNKDGSSNNDEKESVNENKVTNDKKDIPSTDSDTDGKEYTLLDKITSDPTMLDSVINDETTNPGVVSNLVHLKQEAETAPISETCDNNVDGNANDMIATVSDEDCAFIPSTNDIIDTSTISDTSANFTNISTNSDPNTNFTDSRTNTNTTTPTSGTCDIGTDNSTGSTIASTNNQSCTPPTSPAVSDACGNSIDNNTTGTNNVACPQPISDACDNTVDNNTTGTSNGTSMDCIPPISDACDNTLDNNTTDAINCPVAPTVVIDSAVDQQGNNLTPNDLIAPQKVTFTFSAQVTESTQASEEEGPQDYRFECALDDESFSGCSSPTTYSLEKGEHDFVVRLAP